MDMHRANRQWVKQRVFIENILEEFILQSYENNLETPGYLLILYIIYRHKCKKIVNIDKFNVNKATENMKRKENSRKVIV